MAEKPIIIFGGDRDLVELACYYFETDAGRKVAAITMDRDFLKVDSFLDRPTVAFEEISERYPPDSFDLFVSLSYSKVNARRRQKCEEGLAKGYTLPSYVSSRATTFSTLQHGPNCFILEDNTIQPFCRIGKGVTMWSGNHIGHHATISDYVFVTSHVVISGAVQIGEQSFLGVNSTINDSVKIGRECVIGSSSLVSKDLADFSVVSAVPAELSKVPSTRLRGF
jgi:sugar O-acyltransferase (sialic acid O-acetyltransferase NeuD family)